MLKTLTFLAIMALASATARADTNEKAPIHMTEQEAATMSWLGPPPAKLEEGAFTGLLNELGADLPKDPEQAILDFNCKLPAEAGPVPAMEVVQQFLKNPAASTGDATLRYRLFAAAAEGNWIARSLVFEFLMHSDKKGVDEVRAFQLMTWMRQNKIGSLYSFWSDFFSARGGGSGDHNVHQNPLMVLAALQHSYAAQRRVGLALVETPRKELIGVGEEMIACADSALSGASAVSGDAGGPADDSYAWLGPLPSHGRSKAAGQKADKVIDAVRRDGMLRKPVTSFICKSPVEVGPVPMMEAVERYLDALFEARLDQEAKRGLVQAAARGNWLARSLLLNMVRSSSKSKDHYRAAQLLEWLHEHRIGTVYSAINDELRTSQPYNSAVRHGVYLLDIAAALSHDYYAQLRVGEILVASDNQRLAATGKKMLACAPRHINAYRRLAGGQAWAARLRRVQEKDAPTFTPVHHAVWNNNPGLVRELIERGDVDINARSGNGDTALEIALRAMPQNPELIGILLDAGATVHAGPGSGTCGQQPCPARAPLRAAVEHSEPHPQVIAALIAAGAEPFQPSQTDPDADGTPFSQSFASYESGGHRFVLEQFLATGKLDPKSALANLYLVQSTRYLKVMERLLKYGITPKGSDDLISSMTLMDTTPEDERRRIDMVDRLQRQYPFLRKQMRGQQGYEALKSAVGACRLGLALYLLKQGAPPSDASSRSGILDEFLSSCDPREEIPEDAGKPARQAFLGKLKKLRYDVNGVQYGDCPAWLYRDGPCGLPENDDVVGALLNMGAQPYRLTSDKNSNVLRAAIGGCRQRALDMILAKSPAPLDQQGRTVIEQGLELAGEELERRDLRCSQDFYRKTCASLKAMLARAK